jgi:hypothetical protein
MSDLFVVQVDTSKLGGSAAYNGYKESKLNADYFQKNIVENPRITCYKCQVAELCGLDVKLYFKKHSPGLGSAYEQGGIDRANNMTLMQPGLFDGNNGAATVLTIDPEHGLAKYIVKGNAYVVQDDGAYPLSKGQVWGLQEMVNCAEDIYDMEPANMIRGHNAVMKWSIQYRERCWVPPSGFGGIDIYSSRKVN